MPGPRGRTGGGFHGTRGRDPDGILRAHSSEPMHPPLSATGLRSTPPAPSASDAATAADWTRQLPSRRGLTHCVGGTGDRSRVLALTAANDHRGGHRPESPVDDLRQTFARYGLLGRRVSVLARGPNNSVPVADHLFNLVIADRIPEAEAIRAACRPHVRFIVWLLAAAPWTPPPAPGPINTVPPLPPTCPVNRSRAIRTCVVRRTRSRAHARPPLRITPRFLRGGILLSMAENAHSATDA